MKWTKEQEQAILEDGNNILVAAAAGSGKTAVLVERMIQAITNKKIDIDSILIVTFTNAAASEMRERIVDAIYKKLEENPEDKHLQHQLLLLNRASICTIHSFCLEVIRNHFYETQESANFQIGDATEMELLKQEVMEEMFTEKYEKKDEEFLSLLEMYTSYDDDTALKELLFTVYQFIQSAPFPMQMLKQFTEELQVKEGITDFKDTKWGKVLLQEVDSQITGYITELNGMIQQMEKLEELDKFTNTLREDSNSLEKLKMSLSHFDTAYQMAQSTNFNKWPVDRKVESEYKEIAKKTRDAIRKKFAEIQEKLLCCNSATAIQELQQMYPVMKKIENLVLEFTERFTKAKREKNKIDFNDIEHLALQLLLKPKEDGTYEKTKIAEEYTKKFTQIAIDEYQDSNLVQENILKAISNGHNIFMVGDMKQSIYRFRQARPQLFLEKYRSYKLKEEQKQGEDVKIPLFKNFRSRKNILDTTNLVFESIMSEKLGEIEYNTTEYLNLGADFKELEEACKSGKTELHIISLKTEEEAESLETEEEPIENTVLEARMVANKIKELLKSGYPVYDRKKEEYRKATYKDIVILLRATSNLASIYEKELQKLELLVFTDVNTEYITSTEVEMMLNLLKIIDNPMQDIPLVSVLRSPIFAFSDNDLIKIRIEDRNASFYQALQKARMTMDTSLKQKVEYFFSKLSKWQKEAEYMALDELIWTMYLDTGYYYYVGLLPNGQVMQANLKMLFERAREYEKSSFKGIFQFLRFMDKLKESSGDLGAAKVIGENEDVIRIMSIHKSKGLEFPIVFLCNSNKKFNMKDLNAPILLHTDLGMGPKVINRKMQQEYPSLALEAIKIQIRKETIAEEMRILYVALTRAKEKLFITGVEKDLKVEMQKKEEEIQKYAVTQKLDSSLVQKYRSYLDWIELVYLAKPKEAQELIEVQEHTPKEENSQEETVKQVSIQEIMQGAKEQDLTEIKQALEWEYPYQEAVLLPTKMSVTKIKEQVKEIDNTEHTRKIVVTEDSLTDTNKPLHVYRTPNFMAEELTITASQRGTLMHLCISKLQETEEYTIDKLKDLLQQMVKQKQILPKEAEAISVQKLYEYTQSSLFQELKKAKEIAKEQAFYLQIPAKEIYGNHAEEPILVQGIIDLYYISEKGELILVDYKTDYVEKGKEEELVEKYRKQLTLYQRALEQAKKKKVDKIYLYSIYLQKSIEVKEEKNCD